MSIDDGVRALLDFEEVWWKGSGTKAAAIRRRFGLSPSTYYRRLGMLIDLPDALEYSPLVVRRLRRRRSAMRKYRLEGAMAPGHPGR
jgi:hypothetical protein